MLAELLQQPVLLVPRLLARTFLVAAVVLALAFQPLPAGCSPAVPAFQTARHVRTAAVLAELLRRLSLLVRQLLARRILQSPTR